MQTIEIPISEYQKFQEELSLFMGDYTDDLTEAAINQAWEDDPSEWDKV